MRPVLTHETTAADPVSDLVPQEFQLRGQFAGFFRDVFGEGRMVLRVDGEETFLKISKVLRRELEPVLVVDQEVVVTGIDVLPGGRERGGRVVSQVSPVTEAPVRSEATLIRVCANKSCWRNGGQELFQELEQRIAEEGLSETVKLRAVACMDRCKQGPNVECRGCELSRCSRQTAGEILAQFVQHTTCKQR